MSGQKPSGVGRIPKLNAQARADTNRKPTAVGMAEGREPLRGETWHIAEPISGNSGIEPHS